MSFPYLLPLFFVLVAASITDLRSHRISNKLILLGLVFGFLMQAASGGVTGCLNGALGLLLGFALFIPLYALCAMAAGDVKLMAVVGLFLGPTMTFQVSLAVLMCGALLALFWLALKGGGRRIASRYWLSLRLSLTEHRLAYIPPEEGDLALQRFPYALAIASGTGLAVWLG